MKQTYWYIFAEAICRNWNQPALTDCYLIEDRTPNHLSMGDNYTYGDMCREIVRICELFRSLGLQKGDHIAICGINSAHWIIAYLAVVIYQGIVVTILNLQSVEDIAQQINFSDAKALFTDSALWAELKELYLPQAEHVISLEDYSLMHSNVVVERQSNDSQATVKHKDSILSVLYKLCRLYIPFTKKDPDSLSVICFTSGSTGVAKGVMVAHRVYQTGGTLLLSRLPAPKNNRNVMAFLPFAHVFGLVDVNSALFSGAHVYIVRSAIRSSSLISIMELIRPYRMMLIPSIVNGLAAKEAKKMLEHCNEYLKYGIAGGAVISPQTIEELVEIHFPLTIGYGQTEASPLISISSPWKYRNGSCGHVIEGCEVQIANDGEILVKGDNVMLGYYKDPEATARKIDKDGWLHTGDKGHLDEDGYLYVEGRMEQDMIVLPNGENIHPEDIERKINTLPEVSESIVLARDGHLVAIVVPSSLPFREESEVGSLRRTILRVINPELPLYSQLYDVEITNTPLQKTEKQTIKRYLYR